MSTAPKVQEFPKAPGGRLDQSGPGPGPGERLQVGEEKIIKSTRVEVGFFVRKVVDGRVVRQWQFPPERRRSVSPIRPQPVQHPGSGGETEQAAAAESAPQVRALSLEAVALEGDQSAGASSGGSTDGSSTTYEAGFFFRTETVSPPDYGTGPDGTIPPKDS